MANPSKAQLLADVQALLKKRYRLEPSSAKFSVLEAIVYAICHENATMSQADEAIAKFKSGFYDWNEVRVSSIEELQSVFLSVGISDSEARAQRLRRFLRQLFEKTYGFTLDALTKKPLKDASKSLQEYEALQSDYILAEVSRTALGGHALGLDSSLLRVIERLGLGTPEGDLPTFRASLERAVPKNRGAEFVVLLEELAADVCHVEDPRCGECDLKRICPTGQARLAKPAKSPESAGKSGKSAKLVESAPESKKSKPKASSEPVASEPSPASPPAKSKLGPETKRQPPRAIKPGPAPEAKATSRVKTSAKGQSESTSPAAPTVEESRSKPKRSTSK